MQFTPPTLQKKYPNAVLGFSIIEMLVYIAILGVLTVVVINTVLSLAQSFSSIKVSRNINNSALSAFERVVRDIRDADAIDVANSTFDVHPGRLTLTKGATTTEFYLDGGSLKIRENSIGAGVLTKQNTTVTNLVFRHSIVASTFESIKIEMTLSGSQGSLIKTENFYTAAVLRKTY